MRVKYENVMTARFLDGTFDKIERVLKPGEERTAFVREAVEAAIVRRSKTARAKKKRR